MKSFDIALTPAGNSEGLPYLFGDKGGISLGHTLKEPTAPSKVDTVIIQSLHHGAGRKLATDPNMYRDTNGESIGADTRQIGYIMPGGALSLIKTQAITQAADIPDLVAYAAAYGTGSGNGSVVFGVGRQIITIDLSNDSVTSADKLAADKFFTGSVVEWNQKKWMGVCDIDGVTVGAYNVTDDSLVTSNDFMFSWAVSTRNGLFWIRNRSSGVPQLRWTDTTDTDLDDLDTDPTVGEVFGPFSLEIEKPHVTGMGVAGPFAVFASKGGDLWGFNSTEVFQPLTPPNNSGFEDYLFAGPINYVGSWLLIPSIDGLFRFDPRTLVLTDISPSVQQNATPGINSRNTPRRAQITSTTPTGATVVTNFLGDVPNLLLHEMYQDGIFYHAAVADFGVTVNRFWGSITTRQKSGASFLPNLRNYMIAADATQENWKVFRLDFATAGWQPGPENLASTSGLRTGMYTPRPPDVSAQVTQVRGFAEASSENSIDVFLIVDDAETQFQLARLETSGPFCLLVPPNVPPGRRWALAFRFNVTNNSGTVPYIALPLSIDHRFSPSATIGGADFITLKVMASSDQTNKISGYRFTNGRNEVDTLLDLDGTICDLEFGETDVKWKIIIEESQADILEKEDGLRGNDYLVTLTCRRLQ